MKELSLNILDIAMNSVKAGATKVEIRLTETGNRLELTFTDNGCGMTEEQVNSVTDPFFTTRTTRKVGMGIPFLKLAAEQTGGSFAIQSETGERHGTVTTATFYTDHIDFTPLGDIVSSVSTLIRGSPDIRWVFAHETPNGAVALDTDELKAVLGDVPLDNYEVVKWIEEYLRESYAEVNQNET
ncbi:MAG: sensor histidine kinase [Clostridia bacterium]|nr:sensor histidine kinase [Clostridia bacterium]